MPWRIFLALLAATPAYADKVAELRRRLTSDIPESEEMALREMPGTPGAEDLLEEVLAVARKRARPPGPVDLVDRAIEAAASVRERDAPSAAATLFGIAEVTALRAPPAVWHRAMQEFLRCGRDASVVLEDAMESENPNLRVTALRLLSAAADESVAAVRPALAAGLAAPHLDVVNAAGETLVELLEKGVDAKELAPLFENVSEALRAEIRELQQMDRYRRGTTAAPALAEALVRLNGKNPVVAPLLQQLLGELRRMNALSGEQQEFVDLLNVARGRPRRGVSDETYARDELEKMLRDRPPRRRYSSRVVDKADAQAAVKALSHLDGEERAEYAERLASIPGRKNRYFRVRFVGGLETASDPAVQSLVGTVASCRALLGKLHDLRRRRGG